MVTLSCLLLIPDSGAIPTMVNADIGPLSFSVGPLLVVRTGEGENNGAASHQGIRGYPEAAQVFPSSNYIVQYRTLNVSEIL